MQQRPVPPPPSRALHALVAHPHNHHVNTLPLLDPPPPVPPRPKSSPTRVPPPIPPRILPSCSPISLQSFTPKPARNNTCDITEIIDMASNQHGQFYKARNFTIKSAQFNEFSLVGLGELHNYHIEYTGLMQTTGLDKLLRNSMPDAFRDSAARHPPPKCHLGTRKEYINQITDWALGESERKEPVLWMRGPFGVGKTAVAQSSAEALKSINKLVATLFFSRSNTDREDPRRVFPSLVYQITTLCKQFAISIDARIREDPALTTKPLATQFDELLVTPLQQIDTETRKSLEGRVIIIDGLDECRGTLEHRPEDPIIRTMSIGSVSSVVYRIELPVSRSIDHEILIFLTYEFAKIRESHRLSESWPSEEVLVLLVERAAGLWIYVSTIVRFINDENSLGPQDQLRIVLRFIGDVMNKVEPNNPLAEMDFFYTLIMQCVPAHFLKMIQRIILLHSLGYTVPRIENILCISEEQLCRHCVFIQSVMELRVSTLNLKSRNSLILHFYHASFIDYLVNKKRSGDMCIHGDFLIRWQKELLEWLHFVYSHTTDPSRLVFPASITLPAEFERGDHYRWVVNVFWRIFSQPGRQIDVPTAVSISKLSFHSMVRLVPEDEYVLIRREEIEQARKNLPAEFWDKIIRRERCTNFGCRTHKPVWVLGYGDNEVTVRTYGDGGLLLQNDQNLPPNQCPCGGQINLGD
ncbi:hypothetical protein NP233_g10493 [Leucocoprinus birnbaumii]|uniref:Nephrocystin 3-like N-terminal domain-containing protein n=1 Tax=Leucocoprinus birnbaumii TaxID=56174 RepID=A0AAD5VID0_9AGAR|nr:hypothetical protein NP233_g10493 [Leucocoprinus birnbaumii]